MSRREGFWRDYIEEPDATLPWPTKDLGWDNTLFLRCLDHVETFIKAGLAGEVVGYMGWSNCRLCGVHNGSHSFVFNDWEWPDGFKHYVEKHHVRPSGDFLNFILNFALDQEPKDPNFYESS